jgi:DNA-binding protein HU-beta
MRKIDLINQISENWHPKVDVMVTLETMFKEVKNPSEKEKIFISVASVVLLPKKSCKNWPQYQKKCSCSHS